ncbi:heme biosynthesis protein HemY [Tepidicaulis sp. LMO-SS28]|uniref:heme biosynthesis protein HemY n=1 Tax=Tepidicaulis sp. LMO-SS28 TaxID=3447455 RepID=UPI003EE0690C
MRRVLIILAVLALLSLGAIWLAQAPGELVVHWRGYEIRTSFVVGAGLVALIAGAGVYLWQFLHRIGRVPSSVFSLLERRRERKGYLALTKGLVAVAAGDAREARLRSSQAMRLLGEGPLSQLLLAQAAQLDGDAEAARAAFAAMLEAEDTKVIGHRGLFMQAQRTGEREAALYHARAALEAAPQTVWASDAVFQLQTLEGDWDGAAATLDKMVSSHVLDRMEARRRRAVVLTAKAQELVEETRGDASESAKEKRVEALSAVQEAASLEPAFAPAVSLAARLMADAGKGRKAARLVERSWAAAPHPSLFNAYMFIHRDMSAYDREREAQRLAGFNAAHKESHLARARAAIGARSWEAAREALQPFTEGGVPGEPSQQVCELMAEIEEGQFGNRGRARDWLSRALHAPRDPVWVSDGYVSETWLPVCPRTGRFDAFDWKVPEPLIVPVAGPAAPEPREAEEDEARAEAAPRPAVPAPERPVSPAETRREESDTLSPIIPDDPGPLEEEDGRAESPSAGGAKW